MKKQMAISAAVLLFALTLSGSAAAQTSSPLCNNNLIDGNYGFTIEGQKLGGPGPVGPQAGVALTAFDGNGNLTQIDTVTIGGVLVSDFSHPPATGTYTVNSKCTGTFTLHFTDGRPPVTVNFVVTQNGDEIDSVVIPPPPGTTGVLATRSIGKRRFVFFPRSDNDE